MTTTLIKGRIGRVSWGLEWKLQDLWIGVFWRRGAWSQGTNWDVWICLLPCLPLHLFWDTPRGGIDQPACPRFPVVVYGWRTPGKQAPLFAAQRVPGLWWWQVCGWGLHYINYGVFPRRLWTAQEQARNLTGRRLRLQRPLCDPRFEKEQR